MSRVLSCEELISKMPDLYQSCLFSVFFRYVSPESDSGELCFCWGVFGDDDIICSLLKLLNPVNKQLNKMTQM